MDKSMICQRCLKNIHHGVHTCTPTDLVRKLEAENAALRMQVSPEMVDHYEALQTENAELRGKALGDASEIEHLKGSIEVVREQLDVMTAERDKYRKQVQLGFKHLIETECIDEASIDEGYTLVEHLRMQVGRLVQREAAMTQERDEWKEISAVTAEQWAASQAREAALRKDAERYRWILQQAKITDMIFEYTGYQERHVSNAIDAAKEAQS